DDAAVQQVGRDHDRESDQRGDQDRTPFHPARTLVVQKRAPPTLDLEVAEFSPGLEGVVAAETAVSEVDGAGGRLIYRGGYLIEDIVPVASYEETAYLLWHGELPNEGELKALHDQMAAARNLNQPAQGSLTSLD